MFTWRLKSLLGLFFSATAAALCFRLFLIEDYRISSDSMAPSLLAGDLVFVTKFDYNVRIPFSAYEIIKIRRPHAGEIVTFSLPDRGLDTYVKRVVAVEGDRVAIENGKLFINDKPVAHQPAADTQSLVESLASGTGYPIQWNPEKVQDYGPVDIPKDHFFVLGDNRMDSTDSRIWGPVPYSCLKGKVWTIWLSVEPKGKLRRERIGMRVRS